MRTLLLRGNLACKCDTAAPQNARMPSSAAFCLSGFSSAKYFLVLLLITSSPSGSRSLIPWHETDCSGEPCTSFSWSAWTNLLINFKRVKRIASYTTCTVGPLVCNTVRNSSKTGTVLLRNSSITLVTFRSPVASSDAGHLKLMLFSFLVLSFSRSLINWQIVSHCSSTRQMAGPMNFCVLLEGLNISS